jgi:hypothetical protein
MQKTCVELSVASSSFFRTITVGSGFLPDLLTSPQIMSFYTVSARGLLEVFEIPPVGTCTPPREQAKLLINQFSTFVNFNSFSKKQIYPVSIITS